MHDNGDTQPTLLQRTTAVGGLLAVVLVVPVVFAVFGNAALPWVLGVGGVVVLLLGVGIAVRSTIARRFPLTQLDREDVSAAASQIDDAKSRLARSDYAAFTLNAVRNPQDHEASGQIWVYAARGAGIEKMSIELSYAWSTPPVGHAALTSLVAEGFEISAWEPDHWVLLSRSGDLDAARAIHLVADALEELFELPPATQWTFRAFA